MSAAPLPTVTVYVVPKASGALNAIVRLGPLQVTAYGATGRTVERGLHRAGVHQPVERRAGRPASVADPGRARRRVHRRDDRRADGPERERPGGVRGGVAGEVGEARRPTPTAERRRRRELRRRREDGRRVAVPGERPADVGLDPEPLLDRRAVDRLAEDEVDRRQGLGDVVVAAGGRAQRDPGDGPEGAGRRGSRCRGRARARRRRRPPGASRDPASGHRLTARGGRGSRGRTIAQHLYCRTCEPTPSWVSLRGRRDTCLDPRHLPGHPELRGPAVPGPADVDGEHAPAGRVRPGRQADPAARRLQPRRRRRLLAAAGLRPGLRTPRSSSG